MIFRTYFRGLVRNRLGMTMTSVALKLGVSDETLRRALAGATHPSCLEPHSIGRVLRLEKEEYQDYVRRFERFNGSRDTLTNVHANFRSTERAERRRAWNSLVWSQLGDREGEAHDYRELSSAPETSPVRILQKVDTEIERWEPGASEQRTRRWVGETILKPLVSLFSDKGVQKITLQIPDDSERFLMVVAASTDLPDIEKPRAFYIGPQNPDGSLPAPRGICGEVYRRDEMFLVADINKPPFPYLPDTRSSTLPRYRAALDIPLDILGVQGVGLASVTASAFAQPNHAGFIGASIARRLSLAAVLTGLTLNSGDSDVRTRSVRRRFLPAMA